MMNTKKRGLKGFIALLLGVLLLFAFTACGPTTPSDGPGTDTPGPGGTNTDDSGTTEKTVEEIEIKTLPDKVEYFVEEEFSVEGGVITVTYSDNTSEDVAMTDPDVDITAPNTSRVGEKTVTVKYGGKKTTFKVTVVMKGYTVVFDYNYEGAPENTEVNVMEGEEVDEPAAPARTGYTFYDWYIDENCTVLYDFEEPVADDLTLYAQWKEDGATYYDVIFDYNYYGCANAEYPQIVKAGESAAIPALNPTRTDYSFEGWYSDEAGTAAFDASAPINGAATVYAKWEKTKTGESTYVFEAENVNLNDKAGPGYSGENAGPGMIVTNTNVGASGNKFVAYQCKNGNSLEFYIASDEAVEDATLVVRFAAEFSSMTLTPDKYQISVNGTALDYDDIVLTLPDGENQSQFADFAIEGVSLKEGANLVQLKTTNNDALGGTLSATAPIIDCIKITTTAVVIWDGTYGLPMNIG